MESSGQSPVILGALLVFLMVVSAFFAGSEASILGFDWLRLRFLVRKGDERAVTLKKLLKKRESLIGTILVGNNIVNIAASAIATALAISFWGESGIAVATAVMAFFILVFAEIAPKSFASAHAEKVGLAVARPLMILGYLLWPVVSVLSALSAGFLALFGVKRGQHPKRVLSEEEIGALLADGGDATAIADSKRRMLHGIFQMSRNTAREVMVPRTRVVALDIATPVKEAAELFVSTGFTRLPVWRETPDNIAGIIHARDVLSLLARKNPPGLFSALRETFFVPESMTLETLLVEFKARHTHIAVIVDEHGAFEGIVTLEDVLEEIVGEIRDEHDLEGDAIRFMPGGDVFVKGNSSIRDVNKALDLSIPTSTDVTIAGFAMTALGKIPSKGDSFIFGGSRFYIERVSGRRIVLIRISPLQPPPAAR